MAIISLYRPRFSRASRVIRSRKSSPRLSIVNEKERDGRRGGKRDIRVAPLFLSSINPRIDS